MVERNHRNGKVSLTDREWEILCLLANGLTDSEIAEEFYLTIGTVKWYNRQIYNKLSVRNRTEAVIEGERLGLLRTTPQPTVPIAPSTSQHVPQFTTPFIGRQKELAEIARLLDNSDCRLISLVGPGGSGKTRLALETASKTDFSNRVYFVPLQPLQSSDQVLSTIISVLQLHHDQATQPKQALLDYLRRVNLLLILDNFEHVIDASDLVIDILNATSHIKMLVTSREPLKVQEEWVREVDGLNYPSNSTAAATSEYSALQLFAERAQQIQGNFSLDDELEYVIRIAQLVDGLPLALELAAGWLRTLSCSAIVTELTQNTDILTSSTRNIPERHRSMRAVFDHSWRLLSDHERTALWRMAVFHGGCTREAVQQVTNTSLSVFVTLVEKSLVRHNTKIDRYDMQELLRQYAEEKLNDNAADQEETQNRYSAYYADFMYQREIPIRTNRQHQIILEIETEFDNVRSAWQWSVEHCLSEEIEKHLWCMISYYWRQGRLGEGDITFERAIQFYVGSDKPGKDRVLAQLYLYKSYCSVGLGYFEKGRDLLLNSVVMLRGLGMSHELAHALLGLGGTYNYLGVYGEAAKAFNEAEAIFRELQDNWWLGYLLYNRAILSRTLGHLQEAEQLLQESIDLFKPSGDPSKLADAFAELGLVMHAQGNDRAAKQLYQESLEVAHEFPLSNTLGYSLLYLGILCHEMTEDDEAIGYFCQALQTAKDAGIQRLQLDVMLGIAKIFIAHEDKERAVELLTLSAHHSASRFETRDNAQQLLDELTFELPAPNFQSAQKKGSVMTVDEAVEMLYHTSVFSSVAHLA